MADININANGCSNSKTFPKSQTSISWHSNKACTVTFTPSSGNCFGVASITFPPDDQTLPVVADVDTQFTTPCSAKDTYDITFGSPAGKKKKKPPVKAKPPAKKKPAKKAAKKTAAKKTAAKKAPAKSKSKKPAKRKR